MPEAKSLSYMGLLRGSATDCNQPPTQSGRRKNLRSRHPHKSDHGAYLPADVHGPSPANTTVRLPARHNTLQPSFFQRQNEPENRVPWQATTARIRCFWDGMVQRHTQTRNYATPPSMDTRSTARAWHHSSGSKHTIRELEIK